MRLVTFAPETKSDKQAKRDAWRSKSKKAMAYYHQKPNTYTVPSPSDSANSDAAPKGYYCQASIPSDQWEVAIQRVRGAQSICELQEYCGKSPQMHRAICAAILVELQDDDGIYKLFRGNCVFDLFQINQLDVSEEQLALGCFDHCYCRYYDVVQPDICDSTPEPNAYYCDFSYEEDYFPDHWDACDYYPEESSFDGCEGMFDADLAVSRH